MTGEPSRGERALKHILMRLRSDGVDLGYWEAEYQFHPTRKWRLDFAWPELWLGIEIQGSTWARGKHSRGRGHANDCQKISEATAMGWSIMTVTTEQILKQEAHHWILAAIRTRME